MQVLTVIDIAAAVLGMAVCILLCFFPRFGRPSRLLALTAFFGFVSIATLDVGPFFGWEQGRAALFAFTMLLLFGTGAWIASYAIERADYVHQLRNNRSFFLFSCLLAIVLIGALYVIPAAGQTDEPGVIPLGPAGYASAAYLLVISVVGLANIEQTIRHAEEHVRWENKFLLLGLASVLGALIYVTSHVLLYPPETSFLRVQTLRVFPVIFLCACLLILQSWRRSTGRGRVVVSQGAIYSTITLFTVGVYLIASSLLAHWVSQWADAGIPLEPIVFFVSAIALAAVLMATAASLPIRR